MSPVLDVVLRSVWVEGVGPRHDVLLGGEVIVHRSRDPEYEAARVLQARGHRGRFRTVDFKTGKIRMILDIAKAARLRTIERREGGLRVGLHQFMSEGDRTRLVAHRSHQGRPSLARGPHSAGKRPEAAGGATCAASEPMLEDA